MDIAILLFERMTVLDAVGPYEVLSRLPGATVTLVAQRPGPVRNDTGSLGLVADLALEDLTHPDIVLVPGGPGEVEVRATRPVLDWLQTVDQGTSWTTSVCTGSLILGAAGLLEGKRATSHWLALDQLAEYGATATSQRVVFDGKVVTGAGVSAGIDLALALAARIAGDEVAQAIQLGMEYDPQPPFDAGSPNTAPAAVVKRLRAGSRFPG